MVKEITIKIIIEKDGKAVKGEGVVLNEISDERENEILTHLRKEAGKLIMNAEYGHNA